MKLLSITAQKPHSTGSGVYLTELVRGFSALGHEEAVVAGIVSEDKSSISFPEAVAFYPVYFKSNSLPFPITGMSDEMPYESTRYRDLTKEMLEQFEQAFSDVILKAVSDFQPDLILCHHLYLLTAIVQRLLPDRRIAAICHGSDLRQFRQNPLQKEEIRTAIQKLPAVFALHKEQREEILELFGCDPKRVFVLGTGYNAHIFHMDPKTQSSFWETSSREQGSRSPVRLLFAGKLSEKKGVMSLLRSMTALAGPREEASKDFSLCLAGGHGNQAEYGQILSLMEASPVPVCLAGRLSQTELAACMNASDLFILPSFYEGLPLVLMEALACGMRVICTDLPGIRPWMDQSLPGHGIRFVAPPDLVHTDHAVEASLPAFEQRLACAIRSEAQLCRMEQEHKNQKESRMKRLSNGLSSLSWEGVCQRLLSSLR